MFQVLRAMALLHSITTLLRKKVHSCCFVGWIEMGYWWFQLSKVNYQQSVSTSDLFRILSTFKSHPFVMYLTSALHPQDMFHSTQSPSPGFVASSSVDNEIFDDGIGEEDL